MRSLNRREQLLLGLCLLTIFVIVNGFAFRSIYRKLGGSKEEIERLGQQIAEHEQWVADGVIWDPREAWLAETMPEAMVSTGKAQGELAQVLQDALYEREIKIERQTLVEPVSTAAYDEVAVNLRLRGDEAKLLEWLTTLQSPERFQTIKQLKLSLDTKAKETEPQAVCEITIARWFRPRSGGESYAVNQELAR